MPSSTEIAAKSYIAAWQEQDATTRARLIDASFAAEGRIVSPGQIIHGRAALAAAIARLLSDPRQLSARLVGAIEVQGPLFHFRSVVQDSEGHVVFDGFDAGVVDEEGRISVLLTFGASGKSPV